MSVVFAGFRETGKTTFLVALWHTVTNDEVPGALSLETFYEGDREYITQRHSEWLAYEAVKRTLVDHDTPIQMTLREPKQGRLLQLGLPDLSGETFKVQYEERRASPVLVHAIRGATGVALFINPQTVSDPTRIRETWEALEDAAEAPGSAEAPSGPSVEQSPEEAPPGSSGPPTGSVPASTEPAATDGIEAGPTSETASRDGSDGFDVSLCCSQVKYVDLLQQFAELEPRKPLRVAVIVSAMDTLDGTEFADRPEHFLRARMSMLDQYLRTRSDLFQSRVYGVSAQGGAYDEATIRTLAQLGSARIRVCNNGFRDNDITRPIRWLAFGEE